ncbi:MAG TPA: gamma-glutamylcyclotransferase family protein [Burkholderiaceae bacterium]|nr:gamma-glutamylcyclotransferase family protein [Burkholderiaceae bacterium]
MALTLVFVFGTLKDGFPNFAVNRGRRVGGVFRTLDRFPLWLVGERHVPWLIDSPGDGERVAGEVYEVDEAALAAMDELEGVGQPDGYHRKTIRVCSTDDDAEQSVQIYMKHAHQLPRTDVRQGPLAEYTPAHAALYRKRGEQAY